MADQGFTIADLLDLKGVALNIPPMKTSDQFTQRELTSTRRIANLRIHVERAIGRIKNFKLLGDIPNNMARVADQIFFVCAFFFMVLCAVVTERKINNCYTYETCRVNNHGEWGTRFQEA